MIATLLRDIRDMLVSIKLTVVLLVFSIVLILAATLDQVNLGIWAVQEKYFRTFVIFLQRGDLSLPIFPGGYTIGGLLLFNLIGAHIYRFKLSWKKFGIWFVHIGLILLLIGELITGLLQDDYNLRLDEGQTRNYSESFRHVELAITDTSNPDTDTVAAIPESMLAKGDSVQIPKLPFTVMVKAYMPNSALQMIGPKAGGGPVDADKGVGLQVVAVPRPMTYK
jgi:cytochrome c biogenesis factor